MWTQKMNIWLCDKKRTTRVQREEQKKTIAMTRERIELPTVGWFNIHFHHSLLDDFGLESNALPAELTSLNPNLRRK